MNTAIPGAAGAPIHLAGRLPIVTLLLCLFAEVLLYLPAELHAQLYFERAALQAGGALGLLTGQWIHADAEHLYWNMLALAVLGWIIESHSRRLLVCSLVVGMLSVNALLLSPLCELQRYCGLSGLLNTLLVVAIHLRWQQSRSPLIACIALASVFKLAVELYSGQSLLTHISWAPYAPAHLAGLLGGLVLLRFRVHGDQ